ncbi:Kinase suppressor of Ras 1-like protein [Leptotrombidium deliense]|uniref:Kinase suppressor of Ras 1-like protein n=1 Tax=Leptotrombidium deliense TaxID=299467 RepID=A0A443S9H1_9ACAR|nr:Kinase suppressor of Ras 1-like protein [Leptotrombidium deliense]
MAANESSETGSNFSEQELVKKTVECCVTAQAMIDINVEHLNGLRTQCETSAQLTQNEIRTLESKLVKLFSKQLDAIRKCPNNERVEELKIYPHLKQWLKVVGISEKCAERVCERILTFEGLLKKTEQSLKEILRESSAKDEEIRRLLTALRNFKMYSDRLMLDEETGDLDLHWDSWDRNSSNSSSSASVGGSSPRIGRNKTARTSVPSEELLKSYPTSPPLNNSSACPWSPTYTNKSSSFSGSKTNSVPTKDRKQTPPLTPPIPCRKINANNDRKFPTTPPPVKRHQANLLSEPFPLTKSKSHEEHLANRIEPIDLLQTNQVLKYINCNSHHNSFDSLPHQHRRRLATEPGLGHTSPITTSPSRSPPFVSPDQQDSCFVDEPYLPVPPRSPRAHGVMVHVIHHRFAKTVKVTTVTCHLCEKPMFIGYKCRECKYRCHRDCLEKVPPSCGLTSQLIDVFKQLKNEDLHSAETSMNPTSVSSPFSNRREPTERDKKSKNNHRKQVVNVPPFAADSSSNTSSCNSSTPSSPALIVTSAHTPPSSASKLHSFHYPDVSFSSSTVINCENENGVTIVTKPLVDTEIVETQKSNDSDKTVSGTSGSTSTDSEKTLAGRIDSQDSQISDVDPNDRSWPRQNSLTLREWDIPFDELNVEDEIGTGRFGTVFRGNWHGSVAIKRLNMKNALDDQKAIEAFKQEVATFRKTRHENLVLFMGACMKPPHLAIVTSLCKGKTLYTHIHLCKDKFNLNRTIAIALQISQGMGYLHARGIVHKDLKTKNIFYENGKVVITDFGLFSVTRLCHGNRKGEWLTIPKGWLCYLSPELIRCLRPGNDNDLPFSTTTDVFAFGYTFTYLTKSKSRLHFRTVWYELLLGDWPFKGESPEVIIWQVAKGIKQSLVNLQASKEIKDLLMLCWAYKPQERPEFTKLCDVLSRLPKKRLQRSPSHPVHFMRSAESLF